MATELKPCPFCGSEIEIKENVVRPSFAYIECECSGCRMEFAHQQDFVVSKHDRQPINDDFATAWNRRTEE